MGAEHADDIDAIFSGLQPQKTKKTKKTVEPREESDEKYFSVGDDGRRLHEGLPVYTPEELGIGQGLDTEDCPIHCSCCF